MTTSRNLSKTSSFSADICMVAPTDRAIANRSRKYRDLRKDLLNAFMTHAWGIRIQVTAETSEELRKQIRNLYNAANTWSRAFKLKDHHGTILKTTIKTHEGVIPPAATMDMFFVKEKLEDKSVE